MFGNFTAQAGVISNNKIINNIITPSLTWNLSGIPVLDFNPPGVENINDRPRINAWRDVGGVPDLKYLVYLSGGKEVLSPAPTGFLVQPWGDRSTGSYNFETTSITYIKQIFTGQLVNDGFGNSVSFDENGRIICIGAPRYINSGAVFIYVGNRRENWYLQKIITGTPNSLFGQKIKISNDGQVILVGDNLDAVHIYTGSPSRSWNFKQSIVEVNSNVFGFNFNISNDNTIILASDPLKFLGSGIINIYTGNINDGWNLKQGLTGFQSSDRIGTYNLKINDSNNIIFADYRFLLSSSGIITYTGNINDGWKFHRIIGRPDGQSTSRFGIGFDIDKNGNTLAVGAPLATGNSSSQVGNVYIFTGTNSNWIFDRKILNPDNSLQTNFGVNINLNNNGDTLLVSASVDDENGTNAGSAYIFNKNISNQWSLDEKILGRDSESNFGFSQDLTKDGTLSLIGANSTSNLGYSMIFNRATINKKEILGGIDVFTHDWAPIDTGLVNPPIYLWSINRSVPNEIKYSYKFTIGEQNPAINVRLKPLPNCGSVFIPTCLQNQFLVYGGTNQIGCPFFYCQFNPSTISSIESGGLYNLNSWGGYGLARFGLWSFISGSGTLRDITNSTQFGGPGVNRDTIGNPGFFISPNSGIATGQQHIVNFDLLEPINIGDSLFVDVNYAYNGGSRIVTFKGNNSINQFRFIHQNNDQLIFSRAGITNGSPATSQTILQNVYLSGLRYQLTNFGTGFLTEVFDINIVNNSPSYTRIFTNTVTGNNVNWYNFITGMRISVSGSTNFSIPSSDRNFYGIFFNNIGLLRNNRQITNCNDCGTANDCILYNDFDSVGCNTVNPLKTYVNNTSNSYIFTIIGGVDDDLIIDDQIYEDGQYPYWGPGCGYPTPRNGAHQITPYSKILAPGGSLKLGIQSYGTYTRAILCVSSGIL